MLFQKLLVDRGNLPPQKLTDPLRQLCNVAKKHSGRANNTTGRSINQIGIGVDNLFFTFSPYGGAALI